MKLFFVLLQFNLLSVCKTAKIPDYQHSNCVQSLYTILQMSTVLPFTREDRQQIYIAYDNIPHLFATNSPKLQGVVYCLVKNKWATPVSKLQAGDVVQFWNGTIGHCGIFSHSVKGTIYLWSSYPVSNWSLQPFPIPKTLYACRIKDKYYKK